MERIRVFLCEHKEIEMQQSSECDSSGRLCKGLDENLQQRIVKTVCLGVHKCADFCLPGSHGRHRCYWISPRGALFWEPCFTLLALLYPGRLHHPHPDAKK